MESSWNLPSCGQVPRTLRARPPVAVMGLSPIPGQKWPRLPPSPSPQPRWPRVPGGPGSLLAHRSSPCSESSLVLWECGILFCP